MTDDHGASDTVNFIFRQVPYVPVALAGTEQNDVLIGGTGQDYFVFSSNSGHDVITNFNTTGDKIVLSGLESVQTEARPIGLPLGRVPQSSSTGTTHSFISMGPILFC